jgi:hypothetical protein
VGKERFAKAAGEPSPPGVRLTAPFANSDSTATPPTNYTFPAAVELCA